MRDLYTAIEDLIREARELHGNERAITLRSVKLIGELERYNTAVSLGMSQDELAAAIGLTTSVMWKRAQAARVLRRFPEAEALLVAGKTTIANLSLIAPKITEANRELLLRGIEGKSKREVRSLVSRVTFDGRLLEREGEQDLRLSLKDSELALLGRAREVLAAGGRVPSDEEIVVKALDRLLDRVDPMRRAERRAKARAQAERRAAADRGKVPAPAKEEWESCEQAPEVVADESGADGPAAAVAAVAAVAGPDGRAPEVNPGAPSPAAPSPAKRARAHIPAAVRHAVWLRDEGRCQFAYPSGERCGARTMLEIDHVTPHCRGGGDDVSSLRLLCRQHNAAAAARDLGAAFMASKAAVAQRPCS